MQISSRMSPDDFWRQVEKTHDHVRSSVDSTRLFGLAGWDGPAMVGDWEWEDQVLKRAGLAFGGPDDDVSVHVVTVGDDPRRDVVRALSRSTGLRTGDPGYEYKSESIRKSRGESVWLTVDGVGVEFEMWGGPSHWWAAGHIDSARVTIESRNYAVDRVHLVEVRDIDPFLEGRRQYLQAARGELE